ncbi:MAG TPA: ice-binding family protein, partial [Acidimicrobiales bacterium]|nr:ice-binding family protein [Acidimicrobiales bacterium]
MGCLPRLCSTIPVIAVTLAGSVLLGTGASAAPSAVTLGTASGYAVLGGQTVTNTGPSVITGELGLSPGSAVPGFPPGVVIPPGTIHAADPVAGQAQNDLTTAYNTAGGLPCTADLTGQDLGGLTLTRGVYCFSSSAQLTGALTLDGQGDPEADFIFKTGSSLTTASSSTMLLINQAQPCRVFHQVGSSATLGTGSQFVGTILALTSITATTGVSVQGRLLARNGAVTLDTNTITRPACLPPTTSSTVASSATSRPATVATRTATPATVTTRTTIRAVTAATGPGRNPAAATTTTKAPARTTSTRLANTGGQFAVLVAAGLLAFVAGEL